MINHPSDSRRAHWIVFYLEVYVIKLSTIQVIRAVRIGWFFFLRFMSLNDQPSKWFLPCALDRFFLKVYVIKWSTIQVIRAVRIGSFFS